MKPLSIYIHIPFCNNKCYYCDFLSAPPTSETEMADYVAALLCEIEREATAYFDYEVKTIFLGGGTPSVLPAHNIKEILCKLRDVFCFAESEEPEITIEVNPGTITSVILEKYKMTGVNRLSFGLQSANDDELRLLGRIHTYEEFLNAYHEARKVGFENINIDLIQAIPNQSFDSFKETLQQVASLEPEHVSAYSLIVEPGTPFHEKYVSQIAKASEIEEEERERKIYHYTKSYLESKNIMRYEISNYAKSGFACRHNLTYWQRGDYVGFGLGAASLIDNKRWSNCSDLKSYILLNRDLKTQKSGEQIVEMDDFDSFSTEKDERNHIKTIKEKLQVLSLQEQMEEFMFLGLRLTKGVDINHFQNTFKHDINECYGSVLLRLKEQNLIRIDEKISLTAYGIDVSNYVLAQFLF